MYFLEAVKICFQKSFTFKGRASRAEYWLFYLFNYILGFILAILAIITLITLKQSVAISVFIILYCIPIPANISVLVRRLHDVNRSGWWFWIVIIPFGILLLLYWFIKPSDKEENQYGLPPVK